MNTLMNSDPGHRSQERSDFLFINPTFFHGFASIMSLYGSYYDYNYSNSEFEADRWAIGNDFAAVGGDFKAVLSSIDLQFSER